MSAGSTKKNDFVRCTIHLPKEAHQSIGHKAVDKGITKKKLMENIILEWVKENK